MKRPAAITVLLVAASAHADPPAASQNLTFQRAIELSLTENPELALATESVGAAEARLAGQKAKRWVGLGVNASANRWREPYAIAFGGATFTLHEAFTTTTVVALTQPLTGLAYLSELVGAAEHDAEATRRDYDKVRLDTAYTTASAYIRLLEARASANVAHHSVQDIESELAQALQLRTADTLTDIDVLRYRSAKAAADTQALRADSAVLQQQAALVVQLGLHDGVELDISDDLPAEAPGMAMTLAQAQARALAARPELRSARERVSSAEDQRLAAKARYLPDVRAVAAWQHFTGVQPFQPEDEEYVGLTAQWNVWDWGVIHDAVVEAERGKARASLASNALVDQVKLDVRRKWLDAKTQFDSLAVAQQQQTTAEEAYRLQKVKLDNAAATTTDVLDAQTDVVRARVAFATARFDYYLALVALARSVGDLPHA